MSEEKDNFEGLLTGKQMCQHGRNLYPSQVSGHELAIWSHSTLRKLGNVILHMQELEMLHIKHLRLLNTPSSSSPRVFCSLVLFMGSHPKKDAKGIRHISYL